MTQPEPLRCSVASSAVGEQLAGTAPRARAWLVLEQPGPYGFRALGESHLPDRVRAALSTIPKDSRTTVLLARRVGHHADVHVAEERRRFWLAHTAPGGVRMRAGALEDAELLRPDLVDVLDGAARGELPPWGAPSSTPLLLLCTNARRDICCAVNGRPLAQGLAAYPVHHDRVLEVSHLGGHRFSPTALLLPWGHMFGRLDLAAATAVLEGAALGRIGSLEHHRGRTAAARPVQAAACAVRLLERVDGVDDLDALRIVGGRAVPSGLRWEGEDGVAEVEVRHVDGRAWRVVVRRVPLPAPRPESCGKLAVEDSPWVADEPVAVAAWA